MESTPETTRTTKSRLGSSEQIRAEIRELERQCHATPDPVMRNRLYQRIHKRRRKIDVEIVSLPLSHSQLNGLIDSGYVSERSSDVRIKVITGIENLLDDVARGLLRFSQG